MGPFLETLIGGLLTGVLYSLVALGFVLIFKASGVFNFAQGAMVLFAALTLARLADKIDDKDVHLVHFVVVAAILGVALALIGWWVWREYGARGAGPAERRKITALAGAGALIGGAVAFAYGKGAWPMWLAFAGTAAVMGLLAYAIERLVLRHLVNQEGIILFMATLGIAYFLEGFGQAVWGSNVYSIEIGLPKEPLFLFESVFEGGLLVDRGELVCAVIALAMVVVLGVFFQKTRIGRALRAVADDHAAAQSVGIPLNTIWLIVWTVSGLVALVAGMIWGAKLGVQFSISLVALKALPVLILGGFTSVPGAIVGGLIIGAGEKLSEVFLAPVLVKAFDLAGGGIENWFAYVLALVFLLFRPQGLFGERIIERV
jgi:branched-chain amino acid transport system permease protein